MKHRKALIADESEINAYIPAGMAASFDAAGDIAADDDWEKRLAGFSFLDTASVKEY